MDPELLAAIGQVVVDAAALEYFVAVLLAVIDGHRDQDCEDHAVATVKIPGEAMRELKRRACAQLRGQGLSLAQIAGMLPDPWTTREDREKTARRDLADWDRKHPGVVPLTRCDLSHLWRDAKAVLDDRHVIAHSIALEADEAGGQPGLVILKPPFRQRDAADDGGSAESCPGHPDRLAPVSQGDRSGDLGWPLGTLVREHLAAGPCRKNRVDDRAGRCARAVLTANGTWRPCCRGGAA